MHFITVKTVMFTVSSVSYIKLQTWIKTFLTNSNLILQYTGGYWSHERSLLIRAHANQARHRALSVLQEEREEIALDGSTAPLKPTISTNGQTEHFCPMGRGKCTVMLYTTKSFKLFCLHLEKLRDNDATRQTLCHRLLRLCTAEL